MAKYSHQKSEVPKPKNELEAMELIFHGLGFFLTHHFKKTVIAIVALIVLCGGAIYVAMDFARIKYKIEEIAPLEAKP